MGCADPAADLSANPFTDDRRSGVQPVSCRYGAVACPDIAAAAGDFGITWFS